MEIRIDLKKITDLKPEMVCPDCKEPTQQPEYNCEKCKHQLVFFVKI